MRRNIRGRWEQWELRAPMIASDGQFGSTTTWPTVEKTISGRREELEGQERYIAMQAQDRLRLRVQFYRDTDITVEKRLQDRDGIVYPILDVIHTDDRLWTIVEVARGSAR